MRNKPTIRGAVALLLCLCCLCLPLLGMAAPAQAATKENTYCDCTVRCTEAVKNPDCPGCQLDRAICVGKERVCSCAAKCEPGKANADCPACTLAVWACTVKSPEPTPAPTPVCACDIKCTDTTKNADCPVCAVSVADCKGKAPEVTPPPVPVCGCSVKCKAGAVNTACLICKTDMTGCKGKDTTPAPAPAGSYAISIVAPSGWYTKTAKVEIRVADENDSGWKKVEAKIERNGIMEDLTDAFAGGGRVYVNISENCTVYVTVTGKDGKSTTKSRYIECFDRVAPTVKTGLDGRVLRVEASDELSGVEAVYIDGERYTGLTNGTLDVPLRDLGKEYDQFSIHAVDYAGNKSRTVQVKNPNYKAPTTDKDKPATSTPAPTPTPAPSPAPTPAPTPGGATNGGGSTTKPSTGNSGGTQWEGLDPAAPTPEPEQKPFTTGGQGTVIDNATGEDGKEFFTIQTPAEHVFYLVIDRQRGTENVYFLNAVTEADLMALAEMPEEPAVPTPTPKPEPVPDTTPEPTPQPEPEEKSGGNMGMLLLVAAVVLIGGGAAFYFKIYRPKHEANQPDDDYDEAEPFDELEAPWDEEESGDSEEPQE